MLYNTSKNFVFRGILSYRELRGRHEMLSTIDARNGGKLFFSCPTIWDTLALSLHAVTINTKKL